MPFGQEPLVPPEELDNFLNCLGYLWDEGLTAKQIAKEMEFGEGLYKKLKPEHVYYFAEKYAEEYGFKPRRKLNKKPKGMVEYSPDLPPAVVEFLRAEGVLWNDPENPTPQK